MPGPVSGPVVIVGGGQAGFQLAASLRDEGVTCPVTMLADEPELPYQRPPLSKGFLTGNSDAGLLRLGSGAFLDEHRITVRTGCRAIRIDRAARVVWTAAGEPMPYGHLVLATGARNRPLDLGCAALPNVVHLRTLAEATLLRDRLAACRRLVVVGAGFIGLEVATLAAACGVSVTILEAGARPLSRSVSEPVSAFLLAHLASCGVRTVLGTAVDRLVEQEGMAAAVGTRDGEVFPADLVLVGIGVLPNVDLAAAAGLATKDGIVVDASLRTHDPAISAIGDCASFPSVLGPERIRVESVQNAVGQARCLAAGLAGRPRPYDEVPWFWSDLGTVKLQIAGLRVPGGRIVLRGDPSAGAFSAFCFDGGRLASVESLSRPADHFVARKLVRAGRAVTPAEAADLGVNLRVRADAAFAAPPPDGRLSLHTPAASA